MQKTIKILNLITWFLMFVAFAFFIYWSFLQCRFGLPSFDGAINLQVPVSLVKDGKYMTRFDGGKIFDQTIQTKGPVLFPIAILWKIFGIHLELALLVNVFYIFLMIAAMAYIAGAYGIDIRFSLASGLLMILAPGFMAYALGIYGEIPTLALFLCSIAFLVHTERADVTANRRGMFFFLAGMFYSLGVLNKTVLLIAFPAMIATFVIKLFYDHSVRIRELLFFLFGICVPSLTFEIYKLCQVGKWKKYVKLMKKESKEVMGQAGVQQEFEDTPNKIEKVRVHLESFCAEFGFKPGAAFLLIMLLILLVIVTVWFFKSKRKHAYLLVIGLTMFSYFGWWLLITPTAKAWGRRIIIGVILLEMVFLLISGEVLKRIDKPVITNLIVVLAVTVFLFGIGMNIKNVDRQTKDQLTEFAGTIRELKETEDATFYGMYWWQAPVLSFLSGVDFMNLTTKSEVTDHSYLVVDEMAGALAGNMIEGYMNRYDLELKEQFRGNVIYKIVGKKEMTQ